LNARSHTEGTVVFCALSHPGSCKMQLIYKAQAQSSKNAEIVGFSRCDLVVVVRSSWVSVLHFLSAKRSLEPAVVFQTNLGGAFRVLSRGALALSLSSSNSQNGCFSAISVEDA